MAMHINTRVEVVSNGKKNISKVDCGYLLTVDG
jgi:hypothetical protein